MENIQFIIQIFMRNVHKEKAFLNFQNLSNGVKIKMKIHVIKYRQHWNSWLCGEIM